MIINAKIFIGLLAGIIGGLAFVPYIWDIFLRKTKPHIYTWLIWSLLQTTSVLVMIHNGAGTGISPFVVGAILCGCIFLLSFKYGTKNITVFDTICLVGAIIALIFYLYLHNPLISIILVSLIDIIGFIPTFRKSYIEPKTETPSTYIVSAFSSLLAIFALLDYSLITILYPTTLVFTDTMCWLIIISRRKRYYLK